MHRIGLAGHLRLVCGLDTRGRSALRQQSFSAPFHLSKPHWEEGTMVLNVVNPTAGFFTGDHCECEVTVEPSASLVLTAPSASRVHRARGGAAVLRQRFSVAGDGFLESLPEMFIPQAGARYRQSSIIDVAADGNLLFWELFAPGRVASGEVFEFTALDWETRLTIDGQLTAHERYQLAPGTGGARALQSHFSTPYYASAFACSPKLTGASACWEEIHALHEESAWVGCGLLSRGGWAVKVVCANGLLLRRKVQSIRTILYAAMERREPSLRRTLALA